MRRYAVTANMRRSAFLLAMTRRCNLLAGATCVVRWREKFERRIPTLWVFILSFSDLYTCFSLIHGVRVYCLVKPTHMFEVEPTQFGCAVMMPVKSVDAF